VALQKWLQNSGGWYAIRKGIVKTLRIYGGKALCHLIDTSEGGCSRELSTSTAARHRRVLLNVVLTSGSPFYFCHLLFRKGGACKEQKTRIVAQGSRRCGTLQQMVCSYGWALRVVLSTMHTATVLSGTVFGIPIGIGQFKLRRPWTS
jgi:hypothetical protein